MKTTIYKQRIELNHWEIKGIEIYLTETFNLEGFIYSDKTIHFDFEGVYYGCYKITHGEDLYFTQFNDDKDNVNFCLDLTNDSFHQLSENFDFIAQLQNIFN